MLYPDIGERHEKRDLRMMKKSYGKSFQIDRTFTTSKSEKSEEKFGKNKLINSVNLKNEKKHYRGKKCRACYKAPVSSALTWIQTSHQNRQGKIRPEAKLDLHGLNLSQAQPILTKFVLDAHGKGLRLILIITGKGRNTEDHDIIPKRKGILKANVPNWLSMEPLSSKILQITNAHVKHGGGGAFYVYLRKKR